MDGALLFIVFNKPDATARVMETIRAARPPRLYVAADAPREGHLEEPAKCAAALAAATAVDWPCEVHLLRHEANQGCRNAMFAALRWFFDAEPEGIVLEDDMLPCPSFFPYVEELLARFRDDPRIGMVSGCNFSGPPPGDAASYFFSQHMHIWGWGSWRRVADRLDPAMAGWPSFKRAGRIGEKVGGRRLAMRHFRRNFDAGHRVRGDYYSTALCFSLWSQDLLTVLPRHNLVGNIGYSDPSSAHTHGGMPAFQRAAPPRDINFPLVHADPSNGCPHDAGIERTALRISARQEIRNVLRPWVLPPLRALGLWRQ